MVCKKCKQQFNRTVFIDGHKHRLEQNRPYCVNCYPIGCCPRSKLDVVSSEELQKLFDESVNYIEVLEKCGLSKNNNNYNKLNEIIAKYHIDLTKINTNRKVYQKNHQTIYNKSTFLERLENGNIFKKSSQLLNLLVIFEVKAYKCEQCGLSEWNGKYIRLELHHKDGNNKNNRLDNLEILCPNCHSQTDNFRFRNRKTFRSEQDTAGSTPARPIGKV